MKSLYLATTFAAAIACLLTSLLIFARRKSGERSRIILACIVLFSVANYITRFYALSNGEVPELVISAPMLLLAIFMVISYIMYPIEVISPGYLNTWRIIKLYSPLLFLVLIYNVLKIFGVAFPPFHSLLEMLPHFTRIDVWFRIFLVVLVFTPVVLIFMVPYTRRYNNTDRVWMMKYTICFIVNTIAYIIILISDHLIIKTLYYYVSVGCSIYIAYMELFERLIKQQESNSAETTNEYSKEPEYIEEAEEKTNSLCERVVIHMRRTSDYRNPDISLNSMAASLYTNRTTLSKALRELGYTNFNAYINSLRIEDFINRVKNERIYNYQDIFYNVGFRSRSTAIRNFKQYTGKTPSEYFNK
ncbi:helix-turn-helix domain-containing protein [Prevotella sp.]|uniref:helix-turn-helix domain-containing protein n=1 Tax=Prevotella sp. TaxID=59823 RepID=UPI0026485A1D|nr:helix-turn-helix domain-containing protein [Prevotella sp.]MDN5552475.1 helix-turn-helix domain-containing protein [Prevotella sp.]